MWKTKLEWLSSQLYQHSDPQKFSAAACIGLNEQLVDVQNMKTMIQNYAKTDKDFPVKVLTCLDGLKQTETSWNTFKPSVWNTDFFLTFKRLHLWSTDFIYISEDELFALAESVFINIFERAAIKSGYWLLSQEGIEKMEAFFQEKAVLHYCNSFLELLSKTIVDNMHGGNIYENGMQYDSRLPGFYYSFFESMSEAFSSYAIELESWSEQLPSSLKKALSNANILSADECRKRILSFHNDWENSLKTLRDLLSQITGLNSEKEESSHSSLPRKKVIASPYSDPKEDVIDLKGALLHFHPNFEQELRFLKAQYLSAYLTKIRQAYNKYFRLAGQDYESLYTYAILRLETNTEYTLDRLPLYRLCSEILSSSLLEKSAQLDLPRLTSEFLSELAFWLAQMTSPQQEAELDHIFSVYLYSYKSDDWQDTEEYLDPNTIFQCQKKWIRFLCAAGRSVSDYKLKEFLYSLRPDIRDANFAKQIRKCEGILAFRTMTKENLENEMPLFAYLFLYSYVTDRSLLCPFSAFLRVFLFELTGLKETESLADFNFHWTPGIPLSELPHTL